MVDDLFPHEEIGELGYRAVVHGQQTYNGVASLTREEATDAAPGFPGDPVPEQAPGPLGNRRRRRLVDVYVINGQKVGSEKYETKLAWLDALASWLPETHDPAEPLVVLGDFNIAPATSTSTTRSAGRARSCAATPSASASRGSLSWGLVDLHRRHFGDRGELFTWWDYRAGAFHRKWGLRIDPGPRHPARSPSACDRSRSTAKSARRPPAKATPATTPGHLRASRRMTGRT